LDYLVCKLLNKTPAELGEIDPYDVAFLKAGILWEMDFVAERNKGLPFLM
jgi:hypothetical protein